MKKNIAVCLFVFLSCSCSGEVKKSRSEQELLVNYLACQCDKDLDACKELFYQKDTPPIVLSTVRKTTKKNFDYTITSAEIAEIPPEKLERVAAGYPYNGKVLILNLKPLKQIVFKCDLADQPEDRQARGGSIMVGKEGEYYYLVLSKEKPDEPMVIKTK